MSRGGVSIPHQARSHRPNGFGQRLRQARTAAGLTPAELSLELGYDDGGQKVRDWETRVGRAVLPLGEALRDLARILTVSMDWLATGQGDGPDAKDQDALEASIEAAIAKFQRIDIPGQNQQLLQDYWDLIVGSFELLAEKYPTIPSLARSMTRIQVGRPPKRRDAVGPVGMDGTKQGEG